MDELIIITLRGIGLGAVYSMIAYAFNAVYNATAVLNLAQGHLLVLGGLVAAETVSADTPIIAWLGLALLAGLVLAAITAAQGVVTLAPLRSASEQWSWLVTTLAVGVIIDALITRTRGPSAAVVPDVLGQVGVLGTRMPITYIATVALSIVSFVVLAVFYRRTRTGLALSAMAQDFDAARANGIAVRRLQIVAFAVSGALLGIGGFVGARALSLTPISGLGYLVSGFIACVVGGLGNDRGALIAGPLVGAVTMLAAYQFGGQWQTIAALAVLIVVLMIRPRGLFGAVSARAV